LIGPKLDIDKDSFIYIIISNVVKNRHSSRMGLDPKINLESSSKNDLQFIFP